MSGRLIVVSNRIPTEEPSSGGLVVALHEALSDRGGVWVGSHPDAGEERDLFEIGHGAYRRLAFRLSEAEYRDYYLGFSNSVLWPLFHRRADLIELGSTYAEGYLRLNARRAAMIAKIVEPGDTIWMHDYHLLPLAQELRALGVTNRIGFFLHIPFPAQGDLSVLPDPDAFAAWLAAYTLVGLQTQADTARCLEMFRADPRAEFLHNGAVKFDGGVVSVRSFPIGIEVEAFRALAERKAKNPFGRSEPEDLIIGVDRLDYTKGLPNRFRAFEAYLDTYAGDRRPTLLQIAPPTREQVEAYRQIRAELEEISGMVNGKHAELDWTPIRYIHRPVPREQLAPLFRMARVGLVTSLADGMNLVAKEYVAAQDRADPGVLVLSRLAGVAEEMQDALLVNPYNIDDCARAIDTALKMPLAERIRRNESCLAVVERTRISTWTSQFLEALSTVPLKAGSGRPVMRGWSAPVG
ncbi:alpha,alpha-trehalose-phosphate synthase (UDP-forming) [Acidimangrovimonas sediminis]|uniref:alpha,alpha-trehalose-phosphate synthase (UDP-forming) n=1 Tax=Acidimangrovimonas sediminis TaxID=2056283 RepID=UPI000C80D1E4|nr:trehalose-6-phosphate synthase [Acidimangrovimonas sediminis]